MARRSPSPRRVAQTLSPSDRQFLADELEQITRLPLNTAEDEEAWHAATEATRRRLSSRFRDVASVVPHELDHYFVDADIHRKEPSYRTTAEAPILEFIRLLREDAAKI